MDTFQLRTVQYNAEIVIVVTDSMDIGFYTATAEWGNKRRSCPPS